MACKIRLPILTEDILQDSFKEVKKKAGNSIVMVINSHPSLSFSDK